MEKFYTISSESKLGKDYWAYVESREKTRDHVRTFLEKHEIEAKVFSAASGRLGIEPTGKDLEKFLKSFSKEGYKAIRFFKRNSKIGKEWVASVREASLTIAQKPFLPFYFGGDIVGSSSSRLFNIDDTIYCSFDSSCIYTAPDGATEMKASEFWKIVEEYQAKSDNP